MNVPDTNVESMTLVDFSGLHIPAICVYDHPLDFPQKIVARPLELATGQMANFHTEYKTLEECRNDLAAAGFTVIIPRDQKDDRYIVETHLTATSAFMLCHFF